jgi:AcrR family transcriptional regulator
MPVSSAIRAEIPEPGLERKQSERLARRRRGTRARLIKAAYDVMAENGVDAAKIQDITERADVGFGTFYNYFATKDQIAAQVLDCVIDDLGRRNIVATRDLRKKDPSLVICISIRLLMREAIRTPMWQWWALRPDLLVDRFREGFRPFALHDLRAAIVRKRIRLEMSELEVTWALATWAMVGGIHDAVIGKRSATVDMSVAASILRLYGTPTAEARQLSQTALPKYPPPTIDWTFELSDRAERDQRE